MRVLLDECVDQRLRHSLTGHDCHTAGYAGLAGLKNGALLGAAERAGFEVLITVDQSMATQQTFENRRIALLVLCGRTSRLSDLRDLVPALMVALRSLGSGQIAVLRHPE